MSRFVRTLAASAAILLTSCGGGDGGQTDYVLNASPGGIWTGTDAVTGLDMLGLVDELGDFHFIRADGVQFVGTALTAVNDVVADLEGITAFGRTFPDGSTHGTGTLNGGVQERQSLDGVADFITASGTGTHVLIGFAFDDSYFETSSLAIIAGTYSDAATGTVVTIDSKGRVFAQDATNGCVVNGTVSIIEATYNVYRVQVSYASCQGAAGALNDATLTGLATLQDTLSPQQVIAGVTGGNGSAKYAIAYKLIRLSPPTI
jgi:hypothetical protein